MNFIKISMLDETSILSEDTFVDLLDTENQVEYVEFEEALLKKAKELKLSSAFKKRLNAYKAELKKANKGFNGQQLENPLNLTCTNEGKIKNSIDNFYKILSNDAFFKGRIVYNEIKKLPEKIVDDKKVAWTDTDDSIMRKYIEKYYDIYSEKKSKDALRMILEENKYNPLKQIIESIEWDGKNRIETMLSKWLKAEDNEYTKEVSRLIFAGAIHRLYNPGCKFDEVPVLVGIKQGEGKSTFIQCLALDEEYFAEVKEIEGIRSVEIIQGAWICEIAELLALTKAKEIEAVKAYISTKTDKYRKPYAQYVTCEPRQCIFIGTTNKRQFLTDRTGNRRFYPVEVFSSAEHLYDNMNELMQDIRQCYAEALTLYKKNELIPHLNQKLKDVVEEKQQEAVEDDSRIGLIKEYLIGKYITCVRDIWFNCLRVGIEPSRKDSNEITLILDNLKGWKKCETSQRFGKFGPQRCWERKTSENSDKQDINFTKMSLTERVSKALRIKS